MKKNKTAKTKQIKKTNTHTTKVRDFFKRYWYWFVTILVLIVAVLGWCGGMGYFNVNRTLQTTDITILSNSYFKLPPYVGNEKAKYSVPEEYKNIIELKNQVVYGKASFGDAKIKVEAGKKTGYINVSLSAYLFGWQLKLGDKVPKKALDDYAKEIFASQFFSVEGDNVFKYNEEEDCYIAKQEGVTTYHFFTDNIMVCSLMVIVEQEDKSKEYTTDFRLSIVDNETRQYAFNHAKPLPKKETVHRGFEKIDIDNLFTGAGRVYFESSNKRILTVTQDGTIVSNIPGKANVYIVCIDSVTNRTEQYIKPIEILIPQYSIKKDETENPRIGDTITDEELAGYTSFPDDEVISYQSDSTALKRTQDGFLVVTGTGEEPAYIYGYTQDKKEVIKFQVIVEAED